MKSCIRERTSVQAAVGIGGPPMADGFASDAEQVGEFGLGKAQLAAAHSPQAESLQDIIGKLTGIG